MRDLRMACLHRRLLLRTVGRGSLCVRDMGIPVWVVEVSSMQERLSPVLEGGRRRFLRQDEIDLELVVQLKDPVRIGWCAAFWRYPVERG